MKPKLKLIIGLIFLLSLMYGFWFFFSYQSFLSQPNQLNRSTTFKVAPGVGAYQLVEQLRQQGIISDVLFAKIYLRLNEQQQSIQVGLYQIEPEMTLPHILNLFVSGKQLNFQISLIEGLRFSEILQTVQQEPNLKHDANEWTMAQWLQVLDTPYQHTEGLLFADTYAFPQGYSSIQLVKRSYQRLIKVLNEEWEQRAQNLPYETPYEALIMASIIEKETGLSSERPRIAGVFVRRLQKKMRLQTDPTVIYGVGDAYEGDIKRIHLKTDTPYNTYTRKGLPPTPIAIVGREAIWAALNPQAGSELYFVAKGDGSHKFSDTLEEHNKAVRKYILNRK